MKNILFVITIILFWSCTDSYFPNNRTNNAANRTNPIPYIEDSTTNDTIIIDTTTYSVNYIGNLRTWTSNDWDFWEINLFDSLYGQYRTWTSNDWDYWEFYIGNYEGTIRTWTSNDWDYWELNTDSDYYTIRTWTSEDWDFWEINSNQTYLAARTWTSNDFDYWEVYNDSVYYKFRTWTAEDWDYWEIYADTNYIYINDLSAACFIPIFTSSIYIQGITEE
ncbi:MAG: hypothetical protein JXR68_08555 [Bacteroidales bacterium]|nr:hypothetical protein [Bacteroidales bacterium]